MSKLTTADEILYKVAMDADEAFHAAVVKQFGKKRAGDMRYRSSKYNNLTKAAADRYFQAANAWLDVMRKVA